MTTWEYRAFEASDSERRVERILHRLTEQGQYGWELAAALSNPSHATFFLKRPKAQPVPSIATSATLTIQGATMPNAETTDGAAVFQFTNDAGNAVAGPLDSVTQAPVVPVITSDNEAVATVAAAVESTPGLFTAPITYIDVPVSTTVNFSVSPLVNSDGSPVNETAGANVGQPFTLPAPDAVWVDPLPATSGTLTITG